MSVSVACKPSSVIGGHLSRPIVAEGLKRNPESLTGRLKCSFVSCSERGLHRGQVAMPRVSSYLTFPPLHSLTHAVSLCCTFPGVAPAGCYPALCPAELGLSSHLSARGRPAASQTCRIIAHPRPSCQRSFRARSICSITQSSASCGDLSSTCTVLRFELMGTTMK